MIRKHTPEDLEAILDVWYKSSTIAHPFLETDYVEKVKKDMRTLYVPNSETWVYVNNDVVIGFVSMMGDEIVGLFVLPDDHSKGIGTQLVNYISESRDKLEVEVFEKNVIGRAFYSKYGFSLIDRFLHEESNNEVLKLAYKPK